MTGSSLVALLAAGAACAQEAVLLDEITVTATKQEQRAVDALGAVSVVSRAEIERANPQRIGTTLSTIPGVATQENPNDPATAVNIRGLQDFGRVAVTVDGARQNFQRSGHNANGAFFLEPSFLRSVDVTRGPVANVYGSGAIGGVVSFETLRPDDVLREGERFGAVGSATAVTGRQSGLYGSLIGAMRPVEAFGALAGISYRRLNDYRAGDGARVRDSGQEITGAIGKIELRPADGHLLTFSGQYQRFDFTNGPGTAQEPRRENDVTTSNLVARYAYSQPDNPWIDLRASAYVTATDTQQRRVTGAPAQIGQSRYFKIRTTGFDIHNTTRFDVGAGRLSFTYGGDAFEDRVSTFDPAGAGSATTPGGRRTVSGAFVQSRFELGMFEVIGALRHDRYELAGGATRAEGSRTSPKITLGFEPIEGLQFYGTYAEGYRAPSVTETLVSGLHPAPAAFTFLPNPNLRPEIGRTVEAGVNVSFDDVFAPGDRLRGKFAVYRNDVRDYIDSVYTDPGAPCGAPIPFACAGTTFTYANITAARLTGVEGELAYDARAWFASLSGSHVRGDNRTTLQPLATIQPTRVAVGGGLRLLDEKLTIGGRITFVSAQNRLPPASANLASKAYTLVDLYGSYEINENSRAFVTLENVGDVRYQRFRDGDASPGFVAKFGFTTRFGA
ncbi:MAG: TonB-dependent hemoglobin/transferrin/lactoferrin family receptor [Microvirga sp.]|nr:TonB-dependent hemoglobin/transferrin/lactoferrin family receptor [Microvirga sp.]